MATLSDENPATLDCNGIKITRGGDNEIAVALLKDGIPMVLVDTFTIDPHQSVIIEGLEITLPVRTQPAVRSGD